MGAEQAGTGCWSLGDSFLLKKEERRLGGEEKEAGTASGTAEWRLGKGVWEAQESCRARRGDREMGEKNLWRPYFTEPGGLGLYLKDVGT